MTASLNGCTSALSDALRTLERDLSESRTRWDDAARKAFDRRYCDGIVSGGRKALSEMQRLAQELASAVSVVDGLR